MGDLGVWIQLGLDSISAGKPVTRDSYSVLTTKEMVYPALMPTIYGYLHRLGSLDAVLYLHRIVLLIFLFLVYRDSIKSLDKQAWSYRSLFFVSLFYFGISILFIDRPALLAIIPFIVSFKIINQRGELSYKDMAMLVILEIFWVNLHGSWAIILGMVLWRSTLRGYLERRFQTRDWLSCLFVGLATLINPFGYKVWSYLAETDQISRHRNITEWIPTLYPHQFTSQTMAYCLLVLIVSVHAYTKRRTTQWSSPYYPLLFLGFLAIRHTIWPFLSLLLYLKSEDLMQPSPVLNEAKRTINLCLASLVIFFTIFMTPTLKPRIVQYLPKTKSQLFTNIAPVKLAEMIKNENDRRPIFNQFEIGSYLIYSLPNKIYADTRNIIYSDDDIQTYHAISRGEAGWEQALQKYGFGWIMIDVNFSSGLQRQLAGNSRWIKRGTEDSVELYEYKSR